MQPTTQNAQPKTTTHKAQLKRFHTLCSRLGMGTEDKRAIIDSFGYDSSSDMQTNELLQINADLQKLVNPKRDKFDTWRKRVMASIGGWLQTIGKQGDEKYIKAIALRATGNQYESFNKIPMNRLVSLYNNFLRKQQDFKTVGDLAADEIELLKSMN